MFCELVIIDNGLKWFSCRHAAGAAKVEGEPQISAKATATVVVTAGKAAAKSKATSSIKHEVRSLHVFPNPQYSAAVTI